MQICLYSGACRGRRRILPYWPVTSLYVSFQPLDLRLIQQAKTALVFVKKSVT